eukprot:455376-Hanusia_phi.AAC.1
MVVAWRGQCLTRRRLWVFETIMVMMDVISYRLLASLDATRWQFGSDSGGGRAKLAAAFQLSIRLRKII